MRFKICHHTKRWDIVSNQSVFHCSCGRRWRCVIPGPPKLGEKYEPPYWVETFSWARFFGVARPGERSR